jgi:hypothetical protein
MTVAQLTRQVSAAEDARLGSVLQDLEKAMKASLVNAGEVVVALKKRELELTNAKTGLQDKLGVAAPNADVTRIKQGVAVIDAKLKENSDELEMAKEKYRSVRAKLQEMESKRARLSETPRGRSFSVLPAPLPGFEVKTPESVDESEEDDDEEETEHAATSEEHFDPQEFETAFEHLWNGLVNHSGPNLLIEGIKRGAISRGFWLVEFETPRHVLKTWKDGVGMSIKYIGGGAMAARQHTNDEQFSQLVSSYNLVTSVSFIMLCHLPDGNIASSWGTLDKK